MDQAWSQVQVSLREKLGPQNYEIWIQPIKVTSSEPNTVQLCVPNRYYRDWVRDNYANTLKEELNLVLDRPITISFAVGGAAMDPSTDNVEDTEREKIPLERVPIPGVASDKTFDNFVVGACNQFAHAAALAVADNPGSPEYNPLFIYGSTGLGKTHLMHAIGNRVRERDPSAQVVYVTAEQFTNEMISALRYQKMPEFTDKYRKNASLLLIDDVQFVSGKDRTQAELFHTFEWLKQRGRHIVFTADVLPREIKMFEPRLRTRCEGGMLADTQPPDMETMAAILRQKAELLNLDVPADLAQYIAVRIRGNIRELEGVLNRLKALCRLRGMEPTLPFAKEHLGILTDPLEEAVTPQKIIDTVATHYAIKVSELTGKRRLRQLVRPRHVAMHLVRKHTKLSFPEIGRAFGGRDHATVQHACKKIRATLPKDADLRNAVRTIEISLGH